MSYFLSGKDQLRRNSVDEGKVKTDGARSWRHKWEINWEEGRVSNFSQTVVLLKCFPFIGSCCLHAEYIYSRLHHPQNCSYFVFSLSLLCPGVWVSLNPCRVCSRRQKAFLLISASQLFSFVRLLGWTDWPLGSSNIHTGLLLLNRNRAGAIQHWDLPARRGL